MKKLLSIIICFCLLSPVLYGQTKKSQAKKPTTTRTTKTAKKTQSKSASSKPVTDAKKPKIRLFEGTMLYASQEYHSAAIIKYSYGQAYNGQREQSITVSGNRVHVVDQNMLMHTIMDGDANMCFIYSEVTNTGVSYPLADYMGLFSQLSDNSKVNRLSWNTPGNIMYKGDELKTYHATISSKVEGANTTGSVEMWSSSAFKVPDILKSAFYGADTHGLIKKWVWETKGSVPFVGTLHSIVSSELVALKEYEVSPSCFTIPVSVVITPDNISSCKNLIKLYKSHRKAMKKSGLTPKESSEPTLPKIRSEWAFVQSVEEDERSTGDVGLALWGEIGRSIITAAATLTKEEREKWQQERLEEEMDRQMEIQEAEESVTPSIFVPRTTHSTNAKKGRNNTQQNVRSRAISCTDPELMSERYIKWMSKTYAEPGTVYDSRLHIKCHNCHKFKGVCTTCNGMGFYKKIYKNVATEAGMLHNVTSDVPMKGKRRDCGVCGGNGVCKSCKGSGKSSASYMAGSDIKKSCLICRGLKKCKTCDGKGYTTTYTPDTSGQGGMEDESTASTKSNVVKEVQCGQCGGKGKCTHCKGTTYITSFGETTDCSLCNKTGDCYVCHGKKTTSVMARE